MFLEEKLTGKSNKRCLSTNSFELAVQEGSELNDEDSQAALVIRPERLRISGSKAEPEGDENMNRSDRTRGDISW